MENVFRERGLRVEVLDDDLVRSKLSLDLDFSPQYLGVHLQRVSFVADLLARNGVAVIVAATVPYRSIQNEIRKQTTNLVEVFLDAPLEVCIQRDTKGLYARARTGEIKHFPGIDDPFEAPGQPDITVSTHKELPQDSLARIIKTLELLKRIPGPSRQTLTPEESKIIENRLKDLGYL